ncbi:kinase-like domain-containing protein [Boletus reticuloceps]|uniref:Kinase-like domain-containing protein n=1 Tax=Boletus reticuloceps TaxID=495285 RepID=A0A8I2YKA7_9AGAM|nr:kinase-like domain-containing protein [Boletus reticuloceps]
MDPSSDYTAEKLEEHEIFWRDRYYFFQDKGYILRPRYHPEWKASWRFELNPILEFFEDSIFQWKGSLLDATREGKDVFIKRVDITTHPNEVKIASRLGSTESRKDGRNHCVPIISIFSDELDPKYQYIVMPVLRPFNEPDFTSFGEIVDFVNQTLEGLEYMHEQSVAHRDCAAENILMDGSNLYQDGWHPMNTWLPRNGRDDLWLSRKRSEAKIKYYFIDFGLSTQFTPRYHERLVTGELGRIQAPEQISGMPYDPFKLDVYYLGHVYQTKIVDEFKGLEVLDDLARLMTKPNPNDRPSAHEALMIWNSLQLLPSIPPRWTRLRPTREEGSIERIVNNALDVVGMVRGSIGF